MDEEDGDKWRRMEMDEEDGDGWLGLRLELGLGFRIGFRDRVRVSGSGRRMKMDEEDGDKWRRMEEDGDG